MAKNDRQIAQLLKPCEEKPQDKKKPDTKAKGASRACA